MPLTSKLITLILLLTLYACSVTPDATDLTGKMELSEKQENLVVTDLVTAMIQVVELNPFTTTLQVSAPNSTLGKAFQSALQQAGYGLQWVTADQGKHFFAYSASKVEDETGEYLEYKISIGGIEIWRKYTVESQYIYPASILYITGSEGLGNIVLNERIFTQQGGPERTFISGVEIETPDEFIKASLTQDIRVSKETRLEANNKIERDQAILASRIAFFEQAQLDEKIELERFQRIARVQIPFPSESMELGRVNKSAIKEIIAGFRADRDLMQIVSCKDANEPVSSAVRRGVRITEELALSGIPPRNTLNTDCDIVEYGKAKRLKAVALVHRRKTGATSETVAKKKLNSYPSRPIVLTIPYGAGGATDYQARIVTMLSGAENVLGQPMVIVNKPGAGGRNGWTWFSETAGIGGYDIAAFNLPHFIAQSIKFKDVPYNIDTLEPIAGWGADPAVMVVPMDSPFDTLEELIKFAKNNPGELTVSGAGLYVGHHIATLQLEKAANISVNYKSAKGGAAALQDVINGTVKSGMNNMSDAYRARDKVKILAIADVKRNPQFVPRVPTFKELGLNIDDSSVNFRGLMVPKGTPEEVINKLEKAAYKMISNSSVEQKMKEGGSPLEFISRNDVLAMWNDRQRFLTELLRRL